MHVIVNLPIKCISVTAEFYLQDGGENQVAYTWNEISSLSSYVFGREAGTGLPFDEAIQPMVRSVAFVTDCRYCYFVLLSCAHLEQRVHPCIAEIDIRRRRTSTLGARYTVARYRSLDHRCTTSGVARIWRLGREHRGSGERKSPSGVQGRAPGGWFGGA